MSSSDWLKFQSDPSSAGFLPSAYIQQALSNVKHANLEKKLVEGVYQSKHETEQQLKSLIRENLGTFIDSRDAMRSILNADRQLFSGEALGAIVSIFESGRDQCEKLVAPMMETHQYLHFTRELRELLEKFHPVTAVPQILYHACGMRVWSPPLSSPQRGPGEKQNHDGVSNGPASPMKSEEREGGEWRGRQKAASGVGGKGFTTGENPVALPVESAPRSPAKGNENTGASRIGGESGSGVKNGASPLPASSSWSSPFSPSSDSSPALEEELIFWYGTVLTRGGGRSRKREEPKRFASEGEDQWKKMHADGISHCNVTVGVKEQEEKEEEVEPVSLDMAVVQFRCALLFLEEHYFNQKGEPDEAISGRSAYHSRENNSDGIGVGVLADTADGIGDPPVFHEASSRRGIHYHEQKGLRAPSMPSPGTSDPLEASSSEQNMTVASLSLTERSAHPQRLTYQLQRDRTHRLFMYSYATSLLRAALFLLDHLAGEHLRYTNLVHTVAIEEMLGMMMELTTGTVKLHGFARGIREQLTTTVLGSAGIHGNMWSSTGGGVIDSTSSGNKEYLSEGLAWTSKGGKKDLLSGVDSPNASTRRLAGGLSASSRGNPMESSGHPFTMGEVGAHLAHKDPRTAVRWHYRRPISSAAGHWHPVQYYMVVLQWQFQELVCHTVLRPLSVRATLALQQPHSVLGAVLREGFGSPEVSSSCTSVSGRWASFIQDDMLSHWRKEEGRRTQRVSSLPCNGGSDSSRNSSMATSNILKETGALDKEDAAMKGTERHASLHPSAISTRFTDRDMEKGHTEARPVISAQEEALNTLTQQFFALAEEEHMGGRPDRDEEGKNGEGKDLKRQKTVWDAFQGGSSKRGGGGREGRNAAAMLLSSLAHAFASRLCSYPLSSTKEDISFLGSHLFPTNSSSSSFTFENLLSLRILAPSPNVDAADDTHCAFTSFPIFLPGLHSGWFKDTKRKYAGQIQQGRERAYVDATPILLYSCEQLLEHIRQWIACTTEEAVEGMDGDPRSIAMGWSGEEKGDRTHAASSHVPAGHAGKEFAVDAYVLLTEVAYLLEDTITHYWAGVGQSIQAKTFDYAPSSNSTMCYWLQEEMEEEEKRKKIRRRKQRRRRQQRRQREGMGEGERYFYDIHDTDTDSDEGLAMEDEDDLLDGDEGEDEEEETDELRSLDEVVNMSSSLFPQDSPPKLLDKRSSVGMIKGERGTIQSDSLPELRFLPVTTEAHVNLKRMKVAKVLLQDKDGLAQDENDEESDHSDSDFMGPINLQKGERTPRMTLRRQLENQKTQWRSKISLQKYAVLRLQELIRNAGLMMRAILTAFINHCMVHVFIPIIKQFCPKDLLLNNQDERVEVVASLVVEALLQQWEQMLSVLCDTFLEIKRAIIESFSAAMVATFHTTTTASTAGTAGSPTYSKTGSKTSATPQSNAAEIRQSMLNDASSIITEIEQLRSACVKDYIRGVGMLMNAYISLFPFIRHTSGTALERRVRPRLCREHPSSTTSNKLLNTLSVLLDRTVPFLHREEEVYDHQAFFSGGLSPPDPSAGGSSSSSTPSAGGSGAGAVSGGSSAVHRRPTMIAGSRSRGSLLFPEGRGGAGGGGESVQEEREKFLETSDLIAKLGTFQQLLVVENTQKHGKYIGQLCSDLLLVFVDMIHMKCQLVCAAAEDTKQFSVTARQREIVACMADMLCLTYTMLPLFMEHLAAPSLLAWLVMLNPSIRREDRPTALLDAIRRYQKQHLSRVDEHAQLALSAIVQMHLVVPQQQITLAVYQDGFAKPEMDWQRASRLTTAEVRPYLSDVLVIIAEANEALHWIEQPALASAVTQKLLVHLASTMMMGLTVNANYVELLGGDCSGDYYAYGALLLEAEFSTVCKLLETVQQATPKAHILPELPSALQLLYHWVEELIRHHQRVLQSPRCLLPPSLHEHDPAAGGAASHMDTEQSAPLRRPAREAEGEEDVDRRWTSRHARREDVTQVAMRHLAYMLEVILNSQWQSRQQTVAEEDEDGEEDEEEEEEEGDGQVLPTWLERLLAEVEEKGHTGKGAATQGRGRGKKGKKMGLRAGVDGGTTGEEKKKKRRKKPDAVGGDDDVAPAEKAGVAPPSLIAESVMKKLAERIEVQYEKEAPPAPTRETVLPQGTPSRKGEGGVEGDTVRCGGLPDGQTKSTAMTRSGVAGTHLTGTRHRGLFSRLHPSGVPASVGEHVSQTSLKEALQKIHESEGVEENNVSEEEEEPPEQAYVNVWQKAKHHPLTAGIGGSGEKYHGKERNRGEREGGNGSPLGSVPHVAAVGEGRQASVMAHQERRARLRLGSGDGGASVGIKRGGEDSEKLSVNTSVLTSDRPHKTAASSDACTERGSPSFLQLTASPGSPFSRDSFFEAVNPNERHHPQQRRLFKRTTFI